jgi:hypothetical protein
MAKGILGFLQIGELSNKYGLLLYVENPPASASISLVLTKLTKQLTPTARICSIVDSAELHSVPTKKLKQSYNVKKLQLYLFNKTMYVNKTQSHNY